MCASVCEPVKKTVGILPGKSACVGCGVFLDVAINKADRAVVTFSLSHSFKYSVHNNDKCRKYECFSEQQKCAYEESAARALQARKDARRRQDELMRKPWKKPSAPSKDILKRGDGARRRRAALRRSIEKAAGQVEKTLPAMCRWNRAIAGQQSGLREFIDAQRGTRRSTAPPASQPVEKPAVPWNHVKEKAQQRLQALVTGQRHDTDAVACDSSTDSPCADALLSQGSECRSLVTFSPPGYSPQQPTIRTKQAAFVNHEDGHRISVRRSQVMDTRAGQGNRNHWSTIACGSLVTNNLDWSHQQGSEYTSKRCDAQPRSSNDCALTATFGDLLRQSMLVPEGNCHKADTNESHMVGIPASNVQVSEPAPFLEAASCATHSHPHATEVPCEEILTREMDSTAELVLPVTEKPSSLDNYDAECHGMSTSTFDHSEAGPLRSENPLQKQHSHHRSHQASLLVANSDGVRPFYGGRTVTSSSNNLHEQCHNSGVADDKGGGCQRADSPAAQPSHANPSSSTHTSWLQQLMEKMDNLQHLHKQVQQALGACDHTGRDSVRGEACQLAHSGCGQRALLHERTGASHSNNRAVTAVAIHVSKAAACTSELPQVRTTLDAMRHGDPAAVKLKQLTDGIFTNAYRRVGNARAVSKKSTGLQILAEKTWTIRHYLNDCFQNPA